MGRLAVAASCLILLGACASPTRDLEARLRARGYDTLRVAGTDYLHVLYADAPGGPAHALNVYIEHDGQPWTSAGRIPANDPTAKRPVMLELMLQDPLPRVYLGRPCYLGLNASRNCDALTWTHERYSEKVVASMAAALRVEMARRQARELYLFGHSGGGTLAVLLAYRMPQVRAVITLAGNLSVGRWASLHGYSPLAGSLDPATLPPLATGIAQIHHVGELDRNTPPALIEAYAATHPGVHVVRHPGVDHLCCWASIWPDLLASLRPAVTPVQ